MKLFSLFLISTALFAQTAGIDWVKQIRNKPFYSGAGAPSNPCNLIGDLYTDSSNANHYFCPNNGGAWVKDNAGSVSIGGAVTAGTTNSILFVGSGPVLAQDNANLNYNPSTHFLGLGVPAPGRIFEAGGSIRVDGDIFFNNPESYRIFNAGGSGNLSTQPQLNSVGNHFVLYPTTGTLPTDTLTEVVLYRTTVAAEQAGNFERLDISGWVTPFPAWAIQGEKGGTGQFRPLILQPGSNESVRFNTDMSVTFGLGSTPSLDTTWQILDPITSGSGAGTFDSHKLNLVGYGSNGAAEHNASWRMYDNVTSQAGASTLRLQSRIDAASFADRMTLGDDGTLTVSKCVGCTVGFIFPEQVPYSCAGDGTTDDTTCLTNAYNAAAGKVLWLSKTYKVTGIANFTASNVTVTGGGTIKIVAPNAGSAYINLAGSALSTTTSTTTVAFSTRHTNAVRVIGVASTTNIAAGSTLLFQYCDNWPTCGNGANYIFAQVVKVISLSGSNVTLSDPIVIPVDTTHTGNITVISPITGSNWSNITFDGTGTNAGATTAVGLNVNYVSDSTFTNLRFNNLNLVANSAGLYTFNGRGNKFSNISGTNCGSANDNCILFAAQSNWSANNLSVSGQGAQSPSTEFGIGIGPATTGSVVGAVTSGTAGRGFKVQGLVNMTVEAVNASGGTQIANCAIFNGNYNNTFRDWTCNGSTSGSNTGIGFAVFGTGVVNFNLFDRITAFNNQNDDVQLFNNTQDNTFSNLNVGTLDFIAPSGMVRNYFPNTTYGTLFDATSATTNRVAPAGEISVAGGIIGTSGIRDSLLEIRNSTGGVATLTAPPAGNTFHSVGANGDNNNWLIDSFGSSGPQIYGRAAAGTIAAPTFATANMNLLELVGQGKKTTGYSTSGIITIAADENMDDSHNGTRVDVYTTQDGSTVLANTWSFRADSALQNVTGVAFASLPSSPNGSIIYCNNCNSTCTAGGSTGRICFRENGAWTH